MPNVEHQRLEQLFSDALEKGSSEERCAFLDEACAGDTHLRKNVDHLLSVRDRVGSFLEVPPVDSDTTLAALAPAHNPRIGATIGRYRILQEIGEGGFGTVYLAEQEEPVRRNVALKIIKLGMDTKKIIARFEAERQALALMDHTNIARVLDAGATESGRPYFVMELVRGVAITRYCDENRLSTQQRLELFLPVCHAVQHAHQKGIIHRDLKPNNVLVTLNDNQPVPKVIDFGIAKATSQRLTEKTLFTGFREFLGTPEYMSPDQVDTSGLDVDTRTDIYSLGVLLYELLTGATPFDLKSLQSVSYEEICRTIREVEPPTPSARLNTFTANENGKSIAWSRNTELATLGRLIRGDLEWIVMNAMEKDRTRRYATAKDLADDIMRHLRHEPVLAGPPNAAYRLQKFVRRHRVGVLAGSMVCFAVLVGLSLATVGLIQANKHRSFLEQERNAAEEARASAQEQRTLAITSAEEARTQAARSETANRFLQDMLRSVDPSKALGREVSVRYVLDEAAKKMDEGALADQPEVEAAVRMTLGETYQALGEYDTAEVHLRLATSLYARHLGAQHPAALRSNRALAGVLRVKGAFSQAESLLRQTAAAQRTALGLKHPDTLTTMTELALALWGPGRYPEAELIHRETLEFQREVLGAEHIDTLRSMDHLGAVCRSLGKFEEAETLLRDGLQICRRVIGEEHPVTATVMNNLGLLFEDQRKYEQAKVLYRRTYELDSKILGPDHPQTLLPMNNLLRVLRILGNTSELRPLITERLARLRRMANHPDAGALALHALAWELLNCELVDLRNPAEALDSAKLAVDRDGGMDPNMLDTLAMAYQLSGDMVQAVEAQRRAVTRARIGGPYNRAELDAKLVDYLLESGNLVGAAGVSFQDLTAHLGATLFPDFTVGSDLIRESEALLDEGQFEEAARVLRGCLAMRQAELPDGHWVVADTVSRLGGALAGAGEFEAAERLLLDGNERIKDKRQAPSDVREQAMDRIVRLYRSWGRPDEAAKWQRRRERVGAVPRQDPLQEKTNSENP